MATILRQDYGQMGDKGVITRMWLGRGCRRMACGVNG